MAASHDSGKNEHKTYDEHFDNMTQRVPIEAWRRIRSLNRNTILHPITESILGSVHQFPGSIKPLTTFPAVLAEHLYWDKRRKSYWLTLLFKDFDPRPTLRQMELLDELSADEIEDSVMLAFDEALRGYYASDMDAFLSPILKSADWKTWSTSSDTFHIVAKIPVTDAEEAMRILFPLAHSTAHFNGRMEEVAHRTKHSSQALPTIQLRGYTNPFRKASKSKASAANQNAPQNIDVPRLKQNQVMTCAVFGAHCRMGLLSLNTTTIHLYGLPPMWRDSAGVRKVLVKRLNKIIPKANLLPTMVKIRPGSVFNQRTDDWAPGKAAVVYVNRFVTDAEMDAFNTTAAQEGGTYTLDFSRSTQRCWFLNGVPTTRFPMAPRHSFDKSEHDAPSDHVYCPDGKYNPGGAVNLKATTRQIQPWRRPERVQQEYSGAIKNLWNQAMLIDLGQTREVRASKQDNHHLFGIWRSLSIGDIVIFNFVNHRGQLKATNVRVKRRKVAASRSDHEKVRSSDFRRDNDQFQDSVLALAEHKESDQARKAPVPAQRDGVGTAEVMRVLRVLRGEQVQAKSDDPSRTDEAIKAIDVALDNLDADKQFIAYRVRDLERFGIDLGWDWITQRLHEELWPDQPDPMKQSNERSRDAVRAQNKSKAQAQSQSSSSQDKNQMSVDESDAANGQQQQSNLKNGSNASGNSEGKL